MSALNAGTLGIDYSDARPVPSDIRKNGAGFVFRYSAGAGISNPATHPKLCGRTEIQDAVDAGLDFVANSEWYQSRVTEGGAAGAQDGAADLRFWRSRGLAKGASIYVSWDEDPDPAHWPAVDAYLTEYGKALDGHYFVDCYAGTPYLRHAKAKGLIRFGWRPNAGSWSNDGLPYQPRTRRKRQRKALVEQALRATPAAIWQTGNYWYGRSADENIVVRPDFGSHLQALGVDPQKKPRHRRKPPAHEPPPATVWRYVLTLDENQRLLVDGKAA